MGVIRKNDLYTDLAIEGNQGEGSSIDRAFRLYATVQNVHILVENLMFYCHEHEGSDWSGQSVLRTAYKHWLIKDSFLRLDAQAAECNSVGIPVVTYSDESSNAEALKTTTKLRVGETAGAALQESKMKLIIEGVTGSTVDLIPKIYYHDQQTSKSALAMFLVLGHDNAARSLVETHLEMFLSSLQFTAEVIAYVASEHIIRDLVELSFGPETTYPVPTPGDLKADRGITVEDLTALVDSNITQPDDTLEGFECTRHGLPKADTGTARIQKTTALEAAASDVTHQEQLVGLAENPPK